jgi:hypothetical protein
MGDRPPRRRFSQARTLWKVAHEMAEDRLGEVRRVELLWIVVALLAYVVLMRWVLPRIGVPT